MSINHFAFRVANTLWSFDCSVCKRLKINFRGTVSTKKSEAENLYFIFIHFFQDLATRAKGNKLQLHEFQGGTFT